MIILGDVSVNKDIRGVKFSSDNNELEGYISLEFDKSVDKEFIRKNIATIVSYWRGIPRWAEKRRVGFVIEWSISGDNVATFYHDFNECKSSDPLGLGKNADQNAFTSLIDFLLDGVHTRRVDMTGLNDLDDITLKAMWYTKESGRFDIKFTYEILDF